MLIRTSKCHEYGHPEFELEFDEAKALETAALPVKKYLEESVAKGTRFLPQATIQMGWMFNEIQQRGDFLTIAEPDFVTIPAKFVQTITETIRSSLVQKYVHESLALELNCPSIRQSAIVCDRYRSGVMILSRAEPNQRDSGWFAGCSDEDHDHNDAQNLKRISLYELGLNVPFIRQFVALPPDILISFDEEPCFWFNGKIRAIENGSYLEKWIEGVRRRRK